MSKHNAPFRKEPAFPCARDAGGIFRDACVRRTGPWPSDTDPADSPRPDASPRCFPPGFRRPFSETTAWVPNREHGSSHMIPSADPGREGRGGIPGGRTQSGPPAPGSPPGPCRQTVPRGSATTWAGAGTRSLKSGEIGSGRKKARHRAGRASRRAVPAPGKTSCPSAKRPIADACEFVSSAPPVKSRSAREPRRADRRSVAGRPYRNR